MNSHVRRFYRKFADEDVSSHLYHEVIALHETPQVSWEEITLKAPTLPRGWHELARLDPLDRIEFIRGFWLSALPYIPHVYSALDQFFSNLDDVGVYITQLSYDSLYECEIVYSVRNESCFFRGAPPASQEEIRSFSLHFNSMLPEDYLSFLKIHDGFSKNTDTGILKTKTVKLLYQQFQLQEISHLGKEIEPGDLIPFYESFGLKNYQCFFAGWTPGKQIGNVYYSTAEKAISDCHNKQTWAQNLAFPTFSDWLIFYLEDIGF